MQLMILGNQKSIVFRYTPYRLMSAQPQTAYTFVVSPSEFDLKILQLYPGLLAPKIGCNNQKGVIKPHLLAIKALGTNVPLTVSDLAEKTGLSHFQASKTLKELKEAALVTHYKIGGKVTYTLTAKGSIIQMAFAEFRDWQNIKTVLQMSKMKNDPLAYALLVIGFSQNKPDCLYHTLCNYAAQGATIEGVSSEAAAESLLLFYRQQLRVQSPLPPPYLSVFKEFTTTSFQEFFRMLLVAVKPTAEDYNWLVEFFSEISDFHFNPARIAFVNLLSQDTKLRQKLEEFKKNQDQQIKKQNGNLEVTFTIPGLDLSKVDAMPPHLRAIGMRLILEPAKFINCALVEAFWCR